MAASRVITNHIPGLIPEEDALRYYDYLSRNIDWQDGIPSKIHGFTRKAYALPMEEEPEIWRLVLNTIQSLGLDPAKMQGVYLNFYRTGNEYTPGHSHPGMRQVIISLGASRTLYLGTGKSEKRFLLSNGDVIIFGSGLHGIPKEPEVQEGRISIAIFLER